MIDWVLYLQIIGLLLIAYLLVGSTISHYFKQKGGSR